MKRSDQNQNIGEMMLAKTVLEEKNETIERRDRTIRELRSELQTVKEDLRQGLQELAGSQEHARRQGMNQVLEDVLSLVGHYQGGEHDVINMLAARLIMLFKEKYSLEMIEKAPLAIDPEIHQVVEVEQDPGKASSIQVISKGFRIAGKLVRPMRVKVIRGGKGGPFPRADLQIRPAWSYIPVAGTPGER